MPHLEGAVHQQLLHRAGQVQQAQQVGGGAARASDRLGGLFVGETEILDQALYAMRLFERIEVLALDVLDQRDGQPPPRPPPISPAPELRSGPRSVRRGSAARRR